MTPAPMALAELISSTGPATELPQAHQRMTVRQIVSPRRNPCCLARRIVDGCFRAKPQICSAPVVAQSRFHRDRDPYTGAFHRRQHRDFLRGECAHAEELALLASRTDGHD